MKRRQRVDDWFPNEATRAYLLGFLLGATFTSFIWLVALQVRP